MRQIKRMIHNVSIYNIYIIHFIHNFIRQIFKLLPMVTLSIILMHGSIKNFCIGIQFCFFQIKHFLFQLHYFFFELHNEFFDDIIVYNVICCLVTTITQSVSIYTEWFNKNYYLNYISEIWNLLTKVVQYKEAIWD